jgi:pimeloyl-ACP methyl ester carboxylesterase
MRERLERRLGFEWEEMDVPALAGSMQMPLLVLHDRDDREIGWDNGAAIARAWPGAQLVTTSGLGHHRIVSDPDVIRQVLEFLPGSYEAPSSAVISDATS